MADRHTEDRVGNFRYFCRLKTDTMHTTVFCNLGEIDYMQAWQLQEKLFQAVYETKQQRQAGSGIESLNYLLFCEHPHVYTLGKSGDEHNLLINHIQMQAAGASFYRTNRGGDITYHGPGQIVGYPIIDMEYFGLSVRAYINSIEEAIIQALQPYGIEAGRLEGATGVWLDPTHPHKARKICAIGVKTSRYVSMHGFAFNVNTCLDYFNYIHPCGFTDKSVTSLEKELGFPQDFALAQLRVKQAFESVFSMKLSERNFSEL